MKKQISTAIFTIIALCALLASCGKSSAGTGASTSVSTETSATQVSVLRQRDPAGDYAMEPALELFAEDEVVVLPRVLQHAIYNGSEAVEVIAMLEIANSLTPEQVTAITEIASPVNTVNIQITQGDYLYTGITADGKAFLCVDTADGKQYSFAFENSEWAGLIEQLQARSES